MRLLFLVFALLLITACQGPPPTQIYVIVTATPNGDETEPASAAAPSDEATEAVTDITPTPRASATLSNTATPTLSPTPDPRPTPTTSQIQVAEQVFEGGRMFWLQPTEQIWVMVVDGEGWGTWSVYNDIFVEGEDEFDSSIVPPQEGLFQPERGFGKLWRENDEVREALGWGITPEFGYVSQYEYHPGGTVRGQVYTEGPGYHILFSLYGEKFRFNESDNTWRLD